MAKLVWDASGTREFETGLDRGVLYDSNYRGYVWNGLSSVSRAYSDYDAEATYIEGIKQGDRATTGTFEGSITAFTYPNEFLPFEGSVEVSSGLYLGEQAPKTFGLSYRTRVDSDVTSERHYKIHHLYNLTAQPTTRNFETLTNDPGAMEFEWDISSVPADVTGYYPSAHLVVDTRYIHPTLLWILESTFYGNEWSSARQMPPNELISYCKNWKP